MSNIELPLVQSKDKVGPTETESPKKEDKKHDSYSPGKEWLGYVL